MIVDDGTNVPPITKGHRRHGGAGHHTMTHDPRLHFYGYNFEHAPVGGWRDNCFEAASFTYDEVILRLPEIILAGNPDAQAVRLIFP